jgi:hypothetical protein
MNYNPIWRKGLNFDLLIHGDKNANPIRGPNRAYMHFLMEMILDFIGIYKLLVFIMSTSTN